MSGKQRLWLVGAFLLGVGVTVGSYEVTRVVVNTRQALRAASSSIEREPTKKPASAAGKRVPAAKPEQARRGRRRAVKRVAPKGPARGVTPKTLRSRGVKAERQERAVREQRRRRRAREPSHRPGAPRVGGRLIPTPRIGIPPPPLVPPAPVPPPEPAAPESPEVDTGK